MRRDADLDERVASLPECAANDFKGATEAISRLGEDTIVTAILDWLAELALRIEEEWKDESEAGKYAAGLGEAALGGSPDEAMALGLATMLAVQWDADPTSAGTMFESWHE